MSHKSKIVLPPMLLMMMAVSSFGQSFTGAGTGELVIDFGGSYGAQGKYLADVATLDVTVTIDPVALKLGFDQFKISSNGFDLTFNKVFTVGLGQSVAIRTDIHVDPFTLTAQNVSPFALVASTGGHFDLSSAGAAFFPFHSFQLSGDYEITGPSESTTGSFALLHTEGDINSRLVNFDLDANNYPNSVRLLDNGYQAGFGNGQYGTDFGGTVDGVTIGFDFRGMWLDSNSLTLTFIPEPTSAALMAVSGLLLVFRFARRVGH